MNKSDNNINNNKTIINNDINTILIRNTIIEIIINISAY